MADYTPTGVPVTDSDLVSSEIRAEFALIQTAIATKIDSTGSTDIVTLGTVTTGTWNATDIAVTAGGTGRSTSTTAYGLIAAGTTATGAHQTLAAGATTEILVGGGASALPVWTAATGTGAPVRADSPTLVTPALGTPSALVGTNISGTAANLTVGGVSFIPSGTKMLFQQTNAPTGWTKDTTHNDKALRVVSGAASSGGTSAFSTVFGKTATDSHTLVTGEIPAHSHGVTDAGHTHSLAVVGSVLLSGGGATAVITTAGDPSATGSNITGITINNAGGGGGHTHGMDIRVQYVDLIIATRD